MNKFEPDYAVPPGLILSESLEERNLTQKELSESTGFTSKEVNSIITGEGQLTEEFAKKLEEVLDIPAHFWNNCEMIYREKLEERVGK